MALMNWNESLSVGIKKFDEQHQKLLAIINELHDAMMSGKAKEILGNILKELADYTKYHFQDEEKAFEEYNYPEKDAHINEHNALINKVSNYIEDFEKGNIFLSVDISTTIIKWINDHIKKTDKLYIDFFKDKF